MKRTHPGEKYRLRYGVFFARMDGMKSTGEGRCLMMVRLTCCNCGGIMDVSDNRQVLKCPYCESANLLRESESVTLERIRSEQQVKMKELELQLEREKKKTAEVQKQADQQVRLKELEIQRENEQRKHDRRKGCLWMLALPIIGFFVLAVILALLDY